MGLLAFKSFSGIAPAYLQNITTFWRYGNYSNTPKVIVPTGYQYTALIQGKGCCFIASLRLNGTKIINSGNSFLSPDILNPILANNSTTYSAECLKAELEYLFSTFFLLFHSIQPEVNFISIRIIYILVTDS